jgi:hypothetical protein
VRLAFARHVDGPHFTVCPGSRGWRCSIGTLASGRADELQATAWVGRQATGGEQVELTASALGSNARSYRDSGSVQVVTATPKQPDPTTSAAPTTTVTLPPVTLPPVPGSSVGAPGGIFPTVSPGSSSSSGSGDVGFPPAKKQNRTRVDTAAAVVPLDPRLIGGQLAGLAVLAGAIAIAIARLSLRKPKPQSGPEDSSSAKK